MFNLELKTFIFGERKTHSICIKSFIVGKTFVDKSILYHGNLYIFLYIIDFYPFFVTAGAAWLIGEV